MLGRQGVKEQEENLNYGRAEERKADSTWKVGSGESFEIRGTVSGHLASRRYSQAELNRFQNGPIR